MDHILDTLKKSDARVCVVGDIILDEYLFGNIERISPEAPVPIHVVEKTTLSCGGAANVALNIVRATGNVALLGRISGDAAGNFLKEKLISEGVDVSRLVLQSAIPTTRKTRALSKGQQIVRIDYEDTQPLKEKYANFIVTQLKQLAPEVIILSDYNKGVLTPYLVRECIEFAKSTKAKVLVDPKGEDFSKYAGSFLITPNHLEACTSLGISHKTPLTDQQVAHKVCQKYGLENVLVTCGARGMIWASSDGQAMHTPAKAKDVFDVTGAGDAVVAMMALGLSSRLTPEECMQLATVSASIVITKVGCYAPTIAEIEQDLKAELNLQDTKVFTSVKQLSEALNYTRTSKKIVFTNGCFDILHAGHLLYLRKAKSKGDILVIALNSDESVKRLKGNTRPLQELRDRMQLIAGFSCVDYVTCFNEDTPENIIRELQPDILVKGGDWAVEDIVGGDFVKSYGGVVESIDFLEGRSTSKIVDRIREQT